MASAEVDWEREGLLDGVPPERRAGRVKLLERLLADGFRMDELRAAAADGTLTALPTLLELGGPARFTGARERGGGRAWTSVSCSTCGARTASPVTDPDAPALSEADLAIGGADEGRDRRRA